MCHCMVKYVTWDSVTSVVSPNPKFLSLRSCWDNRSKLAKYDHWHTKKHTLYGLLVPPGSQISVRITLRPSVFELQASLWQVHQVITKWRNVRQSKHPIYVSDPKFHFMTADFQLELQPTYTFAYSHSHNVKSQSFKRIEFEISNYQKVLCHRKFWLSQGTPINVLKKNCISRRMVCRKVLWQVQWITPKWPWTLLGHECRSAPSFSL